MGGYCSCSENQNETLIHEYARRYNKRCDICKDRITEENYTMYYGRCQCCRLGFDYSESCRDSVESGILTDEEKE